MKIQKKNAGYTLMELLILIVLCFAAVGGGILFISFVHFLWS